jgi:hypothetical protein
MWFCAPKQDLKGVVQPYVKGSKGSKLKLPVNFGEFVSCGIKEEFLLAFVESGKHNIHVRTFRFYFVNNVKRFHELSRLLLLMEISLNRQLYFASWLYSHCAGMQVTGISEAQAMLRGVCGARGKVEASPLVEMIDIQEEKGGGAGSSWACKQCHGAS